MRGCPLAVMSSVIVVFQLQEQTRRGAWCRPEYRKPCQADLGALIPRNRALILEAPITSVMIYFIFLIFDALSTPECSHLYGPLKGRLDFCRPPTTTAINSSCFGTTIAHTVIGCLHAGTEPHRERPCVWHGPCRRIGHRNPPRNERPRQPIAPLQEHGDRLYQALPR